VVLVTEGELTSDASGRSLSWLNSAGRYRESYHRLRMAGLDRYRTLFARHREADWLRFDGGLTWSAADQSAQLDDRHRHAQAHGYDSHRLRPAEVAAYTPGVDAAAVPDTGALWNPGEGWVDLPSLVRFLVDDFVARGGELVTNAGPSTIVTEAGAVTGVRTGRGDVYPADVAVLATGPAVPAMAAELGVRIPDATTIALLVIPNPSRSG
jgi:glycine/D-amino acid oxidase-like deaminating enzyme